MSNLSSLITQTIGSSAGGVNLITAPSSSSIWTATGGVTVSTTTTAAELPLEGFSSTAVKFALSASSGTAYCDFDCPTALQNFLLQLLWYSRASSAFTAAITLSINSYSSSGNRTSNTSPTVVTPQVSAIIGAGINFETNFLSTSNQYLRLTLSFGAQASAWYSIAQFSIGPSNRTQGPALGLFQETTSLTTVAFGTITSAKAYYYRAGERLIVQGYFVSGTTTGSTATLAIPSGITSSINNAGASRTVVGTWRRQTGTTGTLKTGALTIGNNATVLQFGHTEYTINGTGPGNDLIGTSIAASGEQVYFEYSIPIAEWPGSALNLGPGAQVEYAYNYSTTNTTDTTSFAFGPNGGLLISSNPAGGGCTKQVRFQYPIQSDDLIIVEVSPNGDGKWFSIPAMDSGANPLESLHQEATDYFGLGIYQTSGLPATDVALKFGHYPGSHFTDTTGYNWSAYSTWRYRVRKAKASSPVGFGLANVDGSAGLYKSGSAPGSITGAAIAAGNIGEVYTQTWASVQITTSGVNLCTLSGVQNGNYLVFVEADVGFSSATRIVSPPSGWTTGTATIVWPAQTSAGEWVRALESATSVWNFSTTCRVTTAGTLIVSVASIGGNTTSSCRGRITLVRIA